MSRFIFAVLFFAGTANAGGGVEQAGSGLRLALPVAAWAAAYVADDTPGQQQLFLSLGATAAATYLLKYSIEAEAPNGESRAFPSGHASIAFSSAEFLRRRYGERYGVPAYVAATFVGWSRLYADEHTVEQVLAGAALGIATSYFLTDPRLAVMVTEEAAWVQFNTRW